MSLGHGTKIVRDGLVSYFDGINIKSRPGTSSVWTDVSGKGNHATLYNGPVESEGGVLFDGSNDYAIVPAPYTPACTVITIEGFIKWKSFNAGMFLGFSTYDVWTQGNCLGYNNGASNVVGINAATVSSLSLLNNFHHYTFVMNRTGLLSSNKIYIDGVSQPISPVVAADGNIPGLATSWRIASWNNSGYCGNVLFGDLRVYNRELTQEEIKQNFEALRRRYGI